MPEITHNGHRIFYERHGNPESDRAVILHHGMAQWAPDWERGGWLGALAGMRILALDALGHGRSDRPSDVSDYSIESRANAVIAIADAEGIETFDFFGFSLGGRVGFELMTKYPKRVRRLVAGGMHGLKPAVDQRNLERRIEFLRSSRWRMVERAIGVRRDDGRDNAPEPLALSTEAVLMWDGAEARLGQVNASCLLFCGSSDSILEYAIKTAELIPEASFIKLEGATHASSFYSPSDALSQVKDYLEA